MKKKIRKNTQLPLINYKRAGRPAKNDPGIRHSCRPSIEKPSSLHLTIKVEQTKAEIKNRTVLKFLKNAIRNARLKGLKVLHYSLEYDHVHLLIEASDNNVLARGMQSFGVTFSKAINRLKKSNGAVYKHRYHFRKINSARELKNVMNYIFTNGVKHGTSTSIVNPFNTIRAEMKYFLFTKEIVEFDFELLRLLDGATVFYRQIEHLKN